MAATKKKSNQKPKLPKGVDWCAQTVEWFNSWRDSPRTDNWDKPQWEYLFDTALVHNAVYETKNIALISELRKRLAFMGLDFEQSKQIAEPQKRELTVLDSVINKRKEQARKARSTG